MKLYFTISKRIQAYEGSRTGQMKFVNCNQILGKVAAVAKFHMMFHWKWGESNPKLTWLVLLFQHVSPKMVKKTYKDENKAEYADNSSNVESYNTVICSRYCLRVRHSAGKTMFMAQVQV